MHCYELAPLPRRAARLAAPPRAPPRRRRDAPTLLEPLLRAPTHTFGTSLRLPQLAAPIHATSDNIPRYSLRDPEQMQLYRRLHAHTAGMHPRDACAYLRHRAEASDVFHRSSKPAVHQFNVLSARLR